MPPVVNRTDQRFGRLTAIVHVGGSDWLCLCDCGNETIVLSQNLKSGNSRSCGCLAAELSSSRLLERDIPIGQRYDLSTSGLKRTHNRWKGMMQRAGQPSSVRRTWHGARGITVCDQWRIFENFLEDMGECPEGLTLDRFPDNDGDYEPGNCRWATWEEQNSNRRPCQLCGSLIHTWCGGSR